MRRPWHSYVHAPRCLYEAHSRIVVRIFDGRRLRRRDRIALKVVEWLLDRFECVQYHGKPW